MLIDINVFKEAAAERAVQEVRSGMVVGLGHGSTTLFAIRKLANRISSGKLESILGVPCSKQIESEARKLGIPVSDENHISVIDLTIDGADEVTDDMNLIKGGGGALLREKIVAQASLREIIIVDKTKLSKKLGEKVPVPIEVIPFGLRSQVDFLNKSGAKVTIRQNENGSTFLTDQGNYILDADFGPIKNPHKLADQLDRRAGIVEHGLFLGLADMIIISGNKETNILTSQHD